MTCDMKHCTDPGHRSPSFNNHYEFQNWLSSNRISIRWEGRDAIITAPLIDGDRNDDTIRIKAGDLSVGMTTLMSILKHAKGAHHYGK